MRSAARSSCGEPAEAGRYCYSQTALFYFLHEGNQAVFRLLPCEVHSCQRLNACNEMHPICASPVAPYMPKATAPPGCSYSKEWEKTVTRLGRWIDFENDYKTLDPQFMESVWWVFSQLHQKGLVYRGFKVRAAERLSCVLPSEWCHSHCCWHAALPTCSTRCIAVSVRHASRIVKASAIPLLLVCMAIHPPARRRPQVMPFSTACSTPLSNFEAGLNYKDVSDPAVMASFPIVGDADGAALVAWTTTPWTLPSNVALCVNPELDYVRVKDPEKGKVRLRAVTCGVCALVALRGGTCGREAGC